jgi:hypothetical protein
MPVARDGETVEFWVANWQTGFKVQDSLKGKSRCARILANCEDFLANPYNSIKNPLTLFPRELGLIRPFTLRHENSFAKSLCCKLIPLAVIDLKLTDDELSSVQLQLQSLCVVKALFTGQPDIATRIRKCLAGKVQESERPRPDPLQCMMAFDERARLEGVPYEAAIEGYLAEYQQLATSTTRLSDLEVSVIKIIASQTDVLRRKLEYHWQNFNPISASALPLQALASEPWLKGTRPKDTAGQIWVEICAVNPMKRQIAVQRRIGIFCKNIKDAVRLKKKINLKFGAGRFRDKQNEEESYEIAALFAHFASEFRRTLSEAAFEEVATRFFRGALDVEFLEKVSIKDPNIDVNSFRFLHQYGHSVAKSASSVQLAEAEANAVKAKEDAELVVMEASWAP